MKVYAAPTDIPAPSWSAANYVAEEEAYLEALAARARELGPHPHSGKVVRFPYADSYAQYMVLDQGKTMSLIHVPLGDAWDLPDAHLRGLRRDDILCMLGEARAAKTAGRARRAP